MKIPTVIKWIGVALGTCIGIAGKALDIKEVVALNLSGDVWLLIGFVILAFSVASIVYRMQKENEALQIQVQGIEIPQATPTHATTMPETQMTYIRDREVYISELVRHNDKIEGKVFENCLIVGPALVTFMRCNMNGIIFEGDVESLLLEIPERAVIGPIAFENCVLRNCRFRRIGIIGAQMLIQQIREALAATANT